MLFLKRKVITACFPYLFISTKQGGICPVKFRIRIRAYDNEQLNTLDDVNSVWTSCMAKYSAMRKYNFILHILSKNVPQNVGTFKHHFLNILQIDFQHLNDLWFIIYLLYYSLFKKHCLFLFPMFILLNIT